LIAEPESDLATVQISPVRQNVESFGFQQPVSQFDQSSCQKQGQSGIGRQMTDAEVPRWPEVELWKTQLPQAAGVDTDQPRPVVVEGEVDCEAVVLNGIVVEVVVRQAILEEVVCQEVVRLVRKEVHCHVCRSPWTGYAPGSVVRNPSEDMLAGNDRAR
jgi:hypothetical protein